MLGLEDYLTDLAQRLDAVQFGDDTLLSQIFGLLHWLMGSPAYAMMVGLLYMSSLAGLVFLAYKVYVMVNPMK